MVERLLYKILELEAERTGLELEEAERILLMPDAEVIELYGDLGMRESMASMYQEDAEDSRSVMSSAMVGDWAQALYLWCRMDTSPRDRFSKPFLTIMFARTLGTDSLNRGACVEERKTMSVADLLRATEDQACLKLLQEVEDEDVLTKAASKRG
mmetsp:Transcript_18863/g.44211  ORF Transcript_18863/g.44211 Transcript_18863/m.44211 type:complete len:155 (+) Transcript_18863:115-579(+)